MTAPLAVQEVAGRVATTRDDWHRQHANAALAAYARTLADLLPLFTSDREAYWLRYIAATYAVEQRLAEVGAR